MRGSLDALEAGDEAAYLANMDDGLDVVLPLESTPMHGKEEARRFYRSSRAALGALDVTISSIWGVSSFVIVEYSVDGRLQRPYSTVPFVPDKTIRFHNVDLVELHDGHIKQVWRYDDVYALSDPKALW